METKIKEIKVQDNVQDALDWLEKNYPKGVELSYVDYRDCFEDATQLQTVLKDGYMDMDNNWEGENDSMDYILHEYEEQLEIDEVSEDVQYAMQDWLREHDTSNVLHDLLKNTRDTLCYVDTLDETQPYDGMDKLEYQEQIAYLQKKYGKTDEQKKEIAYVLGEQFYGAPVSFYFSVSPLDLYKALHQQAGKYITIKGAYFSTIDRCQGSNWLGEKGCFDVQILKDEFIQNFYLDSAKGNGYGWGQIAGQTGYDDASINAGGRDTKTLLVKTYVSEKAKRETRLQANWDKTKTCIAGDMNYKRHNSEDQYYDNNFPCGTHCKKCGTFWID